MITVKVFKRIKNLWNLSQYSPDRSDEFLSKEDFVLRKDVFTKPKNKPATIVESTPLSDMFEEYNGEITK